MDDFNNGAQFWDKKDHFYRGFCYLGIAQLRTQHRLYNEANVKCELLEIDKMQLSYLKVTEIG